MNRRSFLKRSAAAVAAPWVITTAGLLMPVRSLWKPPAIEAGGELFVVTSVVHDSFSVIRASASSLHKVGMGVDFSISMARGGMLADYLKAGDVVSISSEGTLLTLSTRDKGLPND